MLARLVRVVGRRVRACRPIGANGSLSATTTAAAAAAAAVTAFSGPRAPFVSARLFSTDVHKLHHNRSPGRHAADNIDVKLGGNADADGDGNGNVDGGGDGKTAVSLEGVADASEPWLWRVKTGGAQLVISIGANEPGRTVASRSLPHRWSVWCPFQVRVGDPFAPLKKRLWNGHGLLHDVEFGVLLGLMGAMERGGASTLATYAIQSYKTLQPGPDAFLATAEFTRLLYQKHMNSEPNAAVLAYYRQQRAMHIVLGRNLARGCDLAAAARAADRAVLPLREEDASIAIARGLFLITRSTMPDWFETVQSATSSTTDLPTAHEDDREPSAPAPEPADHHRPRASQHRRGAQDQARAPAPPSRRAGPWRAGRSLARGGTALSVNGVASLGARARRRFSSVSGGSKPVGSAADFGGGFAGELDPSAPAVVATRVWNGHGILTAAQSQAIAEQIRSVEVVLCAQPDQRGVGSEASSPWPGVAICVFAIDDYATADHPDGAVCTTGEMAGMLRDSLKRRAGGQEVVVVAYFGKRKRVQIAVTDRMQRGQLPLLSTAQANTFAKSMVEEHLRHGRVGEGLMHGIRAVGRHLIMLPSDAFHAPVHTNNTHGTDNGKSTSNGNGDTKQVGRESNGHGGGGMDGGMSGGVKRGWRAWCRDFMAWNKAVLEGNRPLLETTVWGASAGVALERAWRVLRAAWRKLKWTIALCVGALVCWRVWKRLSNQHPPPPSPPNNNSDTQPSQNAHNTRSTHGAPGALNAPTAGQTDAGRFRRASERYESALLAAGAVGLVATVATAQFIESIEAQAVDLEIRTAERNRFIHRTPPPASSGPVVPQAGIHETLGERSIQEQALSGAAKLAQWIPWVTPTSQQPVTGVECETPPESKPQTKTHEESESARTARAAATGAAAAALNRDFQAFRRERHQPAATAAAAPNEPGLAARTEGVAGASWWSGVASVASAVVSSAGPTGGDFPSSENVNAKAPTKPDDGGAGW